MHAAALDKPLFGPLDPIVETRPDGVMVVRAAQELPPYPTSWIDQLEHWATVDPERTFLAERAPDRSWRKLTYHAAHDTAMRIGSALLARGLSPETPFLILSGNNFEHALLTLAGMMVGAPACPISTAYSLVSTDLGKLKHAIDLMTPALVYASDAAAYRRALALAKMRGVEIAAGDATAAEMGATPFSALTNTPISDAARAARAAIQPDGVAKFLLTSGSTGQPKAVINTHRMLSSSHVMLTEALPFFKVEPPVLVDWVPWAHTFGGNSSVGLTIHNGGALYIDEGKPTLDGIAETVANLSEIAPTIYFNVPKGFEELLPHLRADAALRKTFFSRLNMFFYAGAGLSQHLADAYRELSLAELDRVVPFTTSLGATETAPGAIINVRPTDRPGNVGVPHRGVELKLVPNGGKWEARLRGPIITPGYWRRPDLTEAAFDEEGFYKIGDALRLAVPGDFASGFEFDGRVTEDFKLATGTWVSVGPLRLAIIAKFAPLARDVVIAGPNRDDIGLLVFPDETEVKALAPGLSFAEALADERVKAAFRELIRSQAKGATGSSNRVARLALLSAPPSIDKGEVTDKGSLNQRALLANRAADVEAMYTDEAAAHVVRM
jgi:feruloyl-CoA synthase